MLEIPGRNAGRRLPQSAANRSGLAARGIRDLKRGAYHPAATGAREIGVNRPVFRRGAIS